MSTETETVKQYILREFLPGEDADELKGDTPLIQSGILDSISTLSLVEFIERQFDIELEAHDVERLGTLDEIGALIAAKRG